MPFLKPDRYFAGLTSIDIQADLLDLGYTCVLLDMDNTILSRETHDIPADILDWLQCAKDAGIMLCLLSNNWHASPYEWSRKLDIPVVAKACKPLPHGYGIACHRMGVRPCATVAVGDQLSTDVFGAHLVGMAAYLVEPLAEVDLKHTVVVRRFERKILGGMVPETGVAGGPVQ